jgi:DNA repair exonuclease SbcCD ATPase subunit
MIKTVEIINFQSHKHTKAEFTAGTNVIIGASDAGKSAVFRAINWVISNRPLGDAFRSEWGGDTRVILETTEGDIIERVKSNTRNEYIINGNSLKAFGSEVPEQVNNLLQIDLCNIQSQMDMPFLLANTPGEAARMLNQAASIDEIDIALSEVKKAHDQISRSIKYDEGQLKSDMDAMEQYQNLPELETKISEVEEKEACRVEKSGDKATLALKIAGLECLLVQLHRLATLPSIIGYYDTANSKYQNWQQGMIQTDRLKKFIYTIEETREGLEASEHIEEAVTLIEEASQSQIRRNRLMDELTALVTLMTKIQKKSGTLSQLQGLLEQEEKTYSDLMPDVCPLCGTDIRRDDGTERKIS